MNVMRMNNSGQAVVIILLVAVVVATIAFSIAGSSLSNIEQTGITEETNRAFSAAEAGIEEALYNLETLGSIGSGLDGRQLDSGALIKEVTSESLQTLTLDQLAKDDVAQVTLNGAATVRLLWDPTAAVVITVIDSSYNVVRYASLCNTLINSTFSDVGLLNGKCRQDISVTAQDRIMRIRAMYTSTSLSASAILGNLPTQSTVITATGKSGETERTVQVERTVPVAPAFFDYALFSASGSLAK